MLVILIVGLSMAILSAIFWCIESINFVHAVKQINLPKGNKILPLAFQSGIYTIQLIRHLPKLWKLVIDVIVTIFLTGAFGFNGMIGSIIGLSVSNVISVFLISIKKGGSYEHSARHVSR